MKCCDMHPGMLRTRITIERATRSSDGQGGFTTTWAEDPVGGVMASMRASAMPQIIHGQRVSPRAAVRAVIRFRDDGNGAPYYTPSDRVMANGREYSIESVVDVEFTRQWIEMTLIEGRDT